MNFLMPRSALLYIAMAFAPGGWAAESPTFSPPAEEQQLPHAMHSEMKLHPSITVGLAGSDIIGNDNRALQAAVDYIAGLGGGTVEIGEGAFQMYDSLH